MLPLYSAPERIAGLLAAHPTHSCLYSGSTSEPRPSRGLLGRRRLVSSTQLVVLMLSFANRTLQQQLMCTAVCRGEQTPLGEGRQVPLTTG